MSLAAPAPADIAFPTVRLMGLDFAAISERETVSYVLDGVVSRRGGWICPVNLDVLRQWHASEDIRELVADADLVVADGMPLLWAGELQGSPLPERVAGSSLVMSLAAAAADVDASIFLLGGNPGTAEASVLELTKLNPRLRIAGTLCPPFGFEGDPWWLERIEHELRKTAPSIVYVGLGFPKQDRLIRELRDRLPGIWCRARFRELLRACSDWASSGFIEWRRTPSAWSGATYSKAFRSWSSSWRLP